MTSVKQIVTIPILASLLMLSIALLSTVRPAPVLADKDACEASGGRWAALGTIPQPDGSVEPDYSCVDCPSGTTGGASCTAESGTGPALTIQPIDTSVPGTHDCNGVPIAVNVECVASDNPILSYLGGIVNFLAAGVGVVVVAMVTFSGVQYITSRGDPQKLSAAKARLINALIGLVCFVFLYAFLQWIIPGGLLNGNGAGGGNGGSGDDPPTQPSGPQ